MKTITNIQGKDSVVSIRMTAEKTLGQFWTQRKEQCKTSENLESSTSPQNLYKRTQH